MKSTAKDWDEIRTAFASSIMVDTSLNSLAQNLDGLRALREALKRGAPGLEVAGQISVVHANYNLLFLDYGA